MVSSFFGRERTALNRWERAALSAYRFEALGIGKEFVLPVATAKYKPGEFGKKTILGLVQRGLLESGPATRWPDVTGYRITASGLAACA